MKNVLVLLSTYNGKKYLDELLFSVFSQKKIKVSMLVRDDGSTDETLEILKKWSEKESLKYYIGKNLGAKGSFYNLIEHAEGFDYYAFCDQDDVWDEDKLFIAVNNMRKCQIEKPMLYMSNCRLVDAKLIPYSNQPLCTNIFHFNEILVKNHVNGCTMVFNDSLLKLARKGIEAEVENLPFHDHWLYLICSAVDGYIFFDKEAHIAYRQHGSNVVGGNRKLIDKIKGSALINNKHTRYKYSIVLLKYHSDILLAENRELLTLIKESRNTILARLRLIVGKRLKAQSFLEQTLLSFTILFNRL